MAQATLPPAGATSALSRPGDRLRIARGPGAWIAGPAADGFFLVGAPLVAVAAFLPFGLLPALQQPYADAGAAYGTFGTSLTHGFLTSVIYAHLVLVFARSHGNRDIFACHPLRFTVVPIALLAALLWSNWALALVGVLAVWWDVYHSSLQTFGIGRIYDMKAGNDPEVGRRLDWFWNLVFYFGPILGGASLLGHLELSVEFNQVESAFLDRAPEAVLGVSRWLTWGVLAVGVPYAVYYVWAYRRLAREGYTISVPKVALYVVLGLTSVVCWGFNSFGEAFFVMNFFHALQYFFIVWHMEGDNLTARSRLDRVPIGRAVTLALFVGTAVTFGIWATGVWTSLQPSPRLFVSILLVVSILHFWYDGFIWSVRRGQVR